MDPATPRSTTNKREQLDLFAAEHEGEAAAIWASLPSEARDELLQLLRRLLGASGVADDQR